MQKRGNRETAFTLIELLTVIAIVSVLAALLLPALSRAKTQGRSASCKDKLRQMGLALRMYCDDNRSQFPFTLVVADDDLLSINARYWWKSLSAYYPIEWTNRYYHCPEYKGLIRSGETNLLRGSYSYNGLGVYPNRDSKLGLGSVRTLGEHYAPISEAHVAVPVSMYAFADARLVLESTEIAGMSVMWNERGWPEAVTSQTARHANGYNIVFCDAHVDLIKRRDLTNSLATAQYFNNDHEIHWELQMLIQ